MQVAVNLFDFVFRVFSLLKIMPVFAIDAAKPFVGAAREFDAAVKAGFFHGIKITIID